MSTVTAAHVKSLKYEVRTSAYNVAGDREELTASTTATAATVTLSRALTSGDVGKTVVVRMPTAGKYNYEKGAILFVDGAVATTNATFSETEADTWAMLATDMTTQMQAAIDIAIANERVLTLDSGKVFVSSVLDCSGLRGITGTGFWDDGIFGDPTTKHKILNWGTDASGYVRRIKIKNVEISQQVLDSVLLNAFKESGTGGAGGTYMVQFEGPGNTATNERTDIVIENCWVHHTWATAVVSWKGSRRVKVRDCLVEWCGGGGTVFAGPRNALFSGNYYANIGDNAIAVNTAAQGECIITNNFIYNCGYIDSGAVGSPAITTHGTRNIVSENIIGGCYRGVTVKSSDAPNTDNEPSGFASSNQSIIRGNIIANMYPAGGSGGTGGPCGLFIDTVVDVLLADNWIDAFDRNGYSGVAVRINQARLVRSERNTLHGLPYSTQEYCRELRIKGDKHITWPENTNGSAENAYEQVSVQISGNLGILIMSDCEVPDESSSLVRAGSGLDIGRFEFYNITTHTDRNILGWPGENISAAVNSIAMRASSIPFTEDEVHKTYWDGVRKNFVWTDGRIILQDYIKRETASDANAGYSHYITPSGAPFQRGDTSIDVTMAAPGRTFAFEDSILLMDRPRSTSIQAALILGAETQEVDAIIIDNIGMPNLIPVRHAVGHTTYANVKSYDVRLPRSLQKQTLTIADDAAASFPAQYIQRAFVRVWNDQNQAATGVAVITFNVATKGVAISVRDSGADFEVTTGALAGTTGTDAKLTVSYHVDGRVYIENRLGGEATVDVLVD
jgi:hypothetical protein